MAKKTEIQKADTSMIEFMRDKIIECNLTKDQEKHMLKELESIGASSVAQIKATEQMKKLRKQIKESKAYKLEKQIKAQLKRLEKMQEAKAYKILGVIEAHGAGDGTKVLDGLTGLLEGGK